jgi:hypothetical protein
MKLHYCEGKEKCVNIICKYNVNIIEFFNRIPICKYKVKIRKPNSLEKSADHYNRYSSRYCNDCFQGDQETEDKDMDLRG